MRASALISTHNYGAFVRDAVTSVLAQDCGVAECIVVDDGSTDDTGSALAEFGGRVVCLRQENRGQAAALNAAFERATGEVVCFLDADDLWDTGKVKRVIHAFQQEPTVGLVHHHLRLVDDGGRPVPEFRGSSERADGDVSAAMRRKVLRWMFAPTSGLALRREVCKHLFPLETGLKISADELLAPVGALLAPVRYLPETLGSYRIHGKNAWAVGELERTVDDEGAKAERYVRVLDEKVLHANAVLARAGRPLRLSPWIKWNYVKSRALLDGRSPVSYLPRALGALSEVRGYGLGERVALGFELVRRAAKARAGVVTRGRCCR